MNSSPHCTPCDAYMSQRSATDKAMQAMFCPIAQAAYRSPQFMDDKIEFYRSSCCGGRARAYQRPNSY